MVLAGERNAHLFQHLAGLRGMGKPDFRRVPFAVELRCFDGSQRHCAAEHHDRSRFHKRVFHDQPTTNTEEDHHGQEQPAASDNGKDP